MSTPTSPAAAAAIRTGDTGRRDTVRDERGKREKIAEVTASSKL
ncbi:hypothetical protein [Streptomyces sp. NPDC020996]